MNVPRNEPHRLEHRVELDAGEGMRLDVYAAERLGLFSRSQARGRIVEVTVNGSAARLARKVRRGDVLVVTYQDAPPLDLIAENIPLNVVFESDEAIVIDKPQGMVVHPGSGNATGTFLNALLFRCQGISRRFPEGDQRPGIVHRLDKETSGILVAAKNPAAHALLARQFHDRQVHKRYLAITIGVPPHPEGRVEDRIGRDPRHRKLFASVRVGGRSAATRYRVLRTWRSASGARYALVLLAPRTGRTHQLRVHLKGLGAPVLGDPLYGRRDSGFPDATLMLHARSLAITMPGESAPRTFVAPIPDRFRQVLRGLQSFSPSSGL